MSGAGLKPGARRPIASMHSPQPMFPEYRMKPSHPLAATRLGAVALAALAASFSLAAAAQEAIPAEHAVRFIGTTGMVCGTVERTRHATNTEGEPTFLYMGGNFPRHTFTARIPGSIRGTFTPAPEELRGQDVCISGSIQRDASRAEIAVSSAADIRIADIR